MYLDYTSSALAAVTPTRCISVLCSTETHTLPGCISVLWSTPNTHTTISNIPVIYYIMENLHYNPLCLKHIDAHSADYLLESLLPAHAFSTIDYKIWKVGIFMDMWRMLHIPNQDPNRYRWGDKSAHFEPVSSKSTTDLLEHGGLVLRLSPSPALGGITTEFRSWEGGSTTSTRPTNITSDLRQLPGRMPSSSTNGIWQQMPRRRRTSIVFNSWSRR